MTQNSLTQKKMMFARVGIAPGPPEQLFVAKAECDILTGVDAASRPHPARPPVSSELASHARSPRRLCPGARRPGRHWCGSGPGAGVRRILREKGPAAPRRELPRVP